MWSHCNLFQSLGNTNIQYSPNLPSTPSPPHSPGTGGEASLNNVPLVSGNVGIHGQDGVSGVQVLVDSGTTSPGMLVQSGNRGRGRGGRGGRGRGGGRGRRSTSGPPPEIDHNIEVLHQIHLREFRSLRQKVPSSKAYFHRCAFVLFHIWMVWTPKTHYSDNHSHWSFLMSLTIFLNQLPSAFSLGDCYYLVT